MEKVKIRKCQGCNQLFDRKNLIKITKLADGTLKMNPSSKEPGRSIYVCNNPECIKNLIKRKRIRVGLKFNNQAEIEKVERILTALSG